MVIVEEYDGEEDSLGPVHDPATDSSDHEVYVNTGRIHFQLDNSQGNEISHKPNGDNEVPAPPVGSTKENLETLAGDRADGKSIRPQGTNQLPSAPTFEDLQGEVRHPNPTASLFAAGTEADASARATRDPSGPVDDHIQRQRPEIQLRLNKGRTTIPKRLVHREALSALAYPFVEEKDVFVLKVPLSKDEIDELIKNSKSYGEGSASTDNARSRQRRPRRRSISSSSSTASLFTHSTDDGIESARRSLRSHSTDISNIASTDSSDESDAPTQSTHSDSTRRHSRPSPSSQIPFPPASYLPPYYRRPVGEDGQCLAHDVPLRDVKWPSSWTANSQKLPAHHTAKHVLAATQHSENDGTFIDLSFNQTPGVSDIMQWIHVQEARVTLDRLNCLVQALPGLTKEERLVAEKLLHDQRTKRSTTNGIQAHQLPATVVRYDSWDDFPSSDYRTASVTLLAFSIFITQHESVLVDQSQCSKKPLIQTLYPYEDAFDLDRRQVFTSHSASGKELLYTSHVFVLTFTNLLLTFSEVSAATLSEPIVKSTELHEKVARSPQFAAVRTPLGTIVNIEIDRFTSYLDLREQIKLRCLLSDSDVFVLRSPDGSVLDASKWLEIPASLDTPVIEIEVDVFAAQTPDTSIVAQVADITDPSSETEASPSSESNSVASLDKDTRQDTRSSTTSRRRYNNARTTQSEPGFHYRRDGTIISVPYRSKGAYSEAMPSQRSVLKNSRDVQFKHESRKSAPSDAAIAYGNFGNKMRPFMNDPSLRSPVLRPEIYNVRLEVLKENVASFRLEGSPLSSALVRTNSDRSARRVRGQYTSRLGKGDTRKAERKKTRAQITNSGFEREDGRDLPPRKADNGTGMISEGSAAGRASSSAIISFQGSSAPPQENNVDAATSPSSTADITPLHNNQAKVRDSHRIFKPLEPQQATSGGATLESRHVEDTGQAADTSSWKEKALSRSLFLPHLLETPDGRKDDSASRPWPPEADLGGESQNNTAVGSNQVQHFAQNSCQYTKHKSDRCHHYRAKVPPIFVWGSGHLRSDPGLRWIYDSILKGCHERLSQARKEDNLHSMYTRAYAVDMTTLAAVLNLGGIKHSHDQEARLLTGRGVRRICATVFSSIEVQQESHAPNLSALAASLVTYTGCVLELFVTIDVPAEPLYKVWGTLARMQESIRSTTAVSHLVLKDPRTCDKIAEKCGVPKPSLRVDPGHQCNSLAFASLEDAVQHLQRFHYAPGCAPTFAVLKSFVAEEKADRRRSRLISLLGVLQQYHQYLEAFFEGVEDIVLSVATADATTRTQLKLTVSLVRSFESFVHTHVKFAQLFGVIDRSRRSSSGRDLSLRFLNKLPGLKREAAGMCDKSLETLRTAYHEIVVLSRVKASIAAVELSHVGMPSLVAAMLYNAQASIFTEGDNVVQQYERCVVKLQFQVNRFPRKKQLQQIHRLQEELAAVRQIIGSSAQIVKNYMTILSPDTFRMVPPTRTTTFPIEAGLLNRALYNAHDHLNALSVLQHRANGLADQVKRSVEVMEEDHGKAILTFTVVTTIFLPLSFLTGFFGMNTSDIRNMQQGQATFWAVAVPFTIVVASAILFLAFKGGDLLEMVGGASGILASIRRGYVIAGKAFTAVPRAVPKRRSRRTDTGLTLELV